MHLFNHLFKNNFTISFTEQKDATLNQTKQPFKLSNHQKIKI